MYSRRQVSVLLLAFGISVLVPKAVLGQSPKSEQNQTQETDEQQIRRIVTDSQFQETLGIYVNPTTFDRAILTKYWVPESKGGKAIIQVQDSIRRLLDRHWHYSKDSANELFEIRSLKIYPPGDVAEVRTRERWYLPMLDEQDHLVLERDPILQYQVIYRLVKVEGRWLLQTNSTPRPEN